MDILDDMGVSKLSAKVFSKVNYSFKVCVKTKYKEICLFLVGKFECPASCFLSIYTLIIRAVFTTHTPFQSGFTANP